MVKKILMSAVAITVVAVMFTGCGKKKATQTTVVSAVTEEATTELAAETEEATTETVTESPAEETSQETTEPPKADTSTSLSKSSSSGNSSHSSSSGSSSSASSSGNTSNSSSSENKSSSGNTSSSGSSSSGDSSADSSVDYGIGSASSIPIIGFKFGEYEDNKDDNQGGPCPYELMTLTTRTFTDGHGNTGVVDGYYRANNASTSPRMDIQILRKYNITDNPGTGLASGSVFIGTYDEGEIYFCHLIIGQKLYDKYNN